MFSRHIGFGGMRSDQNLNGSCPQIGSQVLKVSLQRTETGSYGLYTVDGFTQDGSGRTFSS